MTARADLISVVEACYELGAPEPTWLQQLADRFQAVLAAEHGLLAYHIELDALGPSFRHPVQSGNLDLDVVARIREMGELLERKRRGDVGLLDRAKAAIYERVVRTAITESPDRLLLSEYRRVGPTWMYTLGAPVTDLFGLMNHHVDHHGVTVLVGGLKRNRALRPAERCAFQMLSAHLKAGLRLRRRLEIAGRGVEVPPEGAVLSPSGRVLHAEGGARDAPARDELGARAAEIDRARAARSGRGEDALAVWRGLVQGRWSLVEQFDADGRRFVLAHRNPEDVRDPRGLTEMESRVVGLGVRGYSDKLIAYHLGIAEGTASSHLTQAMRKLRITSRIALVRDLGHRYPQPKL